MDIRAEISSLQTSMAFGLAASEDEDKMHVWKLLIRLTTNYTINLARNPVVETSDQKDVVDISLHIELQSLWSMFIRNRRMILSIWISIFRLYSTSRSDAIAQSKSFLHGYRIIFNCFRTDTDHLFECNRYTLTLLTALMETSTGEKERYARLTMDILSEQTEQVQYLWMKHCCTVSVEGNSHKDDYKKHLQFMSASSPTFATRLLLMALRIFDRLAISNKQSRLSSSSITTSTISTANANIETASSKAERRTKTLQCLVSAVLPNETNPPESIEELIVTIFLRENSPSLRSQPLTAVLVDVLIGAIAKWTTPLYATMQISVAVARLWGQKMFILSSGQGNKRIAQVYLTRVILRCLKREEVDAAAVLGTPLLADGVSTPLALLLSMGVSTYMDSSDNLTRTNGMKVARCYAKIVGHNLQFEGLEEDDDDDDDGEDIDPIYTVESAELDAKKRNASHTLPTEPGGEGDEDEEIDSIMGYPIEDESKYDDKQFKTNYLHVCLEYLRFPESKPDAFKRHKFGMERIPIIMSRNPFDGRDLAGPLIHELLNLPNSFSMDNFDELKAAAVLCISAMYPKISIPHLTETVLSSRIALGIKLQAVAYIRKAAVAMTDNLTSSASPTESDHHVQNNMCIDTIAPTNTRIKRPTVLKILNTKKLQLEKTRDNQKLKFSSIADLFFFPMLQYLASKLRPDAGRRQEGDGTDQNGAKEFNLISELFDSSQEQVRISSTTTTATVAPLRRRGVEPVASSNAPSSLSSSSSFGRQMYVLDDTDSVDVLLPTEVLHALADFCRCCRASNDSRMFSCETVKVALFFRTAADIGLRRASLVAIHAALECYLSSFAEAPSPSRPEAFQPRGIMDNLLHVVVSPESDDSVVPFEDMKSMRIFQEDCMVVAVDWAASSLRQEGDVIIQAILQAIVKLAIEC